MMTSNKLCTIISIIFLVSSHVSAHKFLLTPLSFRNPKDASIPASTKDYDLMNPLKPDGSNFPCKLYHLNTPSQHITANYSAGGTYNMTLSGGATHNGGSCQISLSYDNGTSFRVIKSMIGGCPLNETYPFTIPDNAPSGKALFAWTWVNLIGNREFYMDCALVDIKGKRSASASDEASGSALLDRPNICIANLADINDCRTHEDRVAVFPHPGTDVLYDQDKRTFEPLTCDCDAPFKTVSTSTASSSSSASQTSSTSTSTSTSMTSVDIEISKSAHDMAMSMSMDDVSSSMAKEATTTTTTESSSFTSSGSATPPSSSMSSIPSTSSTSSAASSSATTTSKSRWSFVKVNAANAKIAPGNVNGFVDNPPYPTTVRRVIGGVAYIPLGATSIPRFGSGYPRPGLTGVLAIGTGRSTVGSVTPTTTALPNLNIAPNPIGLPAPGRYLPSSIAAPLLNSPVSLKSIPFLYNPLSFLGFRPQPYVYRPQPPSTSSSRTTPDSTTSDTSNEDHSTSNPNLEEGIRILSILKIPIPFSLLPTPPPSLDPPSLEPPLGPVSDDPSLLGLSSLDVSSSLASPESVPSYLEPVDLESSYMKDPTSSILVKRQQPPPPGPPPPPPQGQQQQQPMPPCPSVYTVHVPPPPGSTPPGSPSQACYPGTVRCISQRGYRGCNQTPQGYQYSSPMQVQSNQICYPSYAVCPDSSGPYCQNGVYRDDHIGANPQGNGQLGSGQFPDNVGWPDYQDYEPSQYDFGNGQCHPDGAILCTHRGFGWSICDHGGWTSMGSVAQGTRCQNGRISWP